MCPRCQGDTDIAHVLRCVGGVWLICNGAVWQPRREEGRGTAGARQVQANTATISRNNNMSDSHKGRGAQVNHHLALLHWPHRYQSNSAAEQLREKELLSTVVKLKSAAVEFGEYETVITSNSHPGETLRESSCSIIHIKGDTNLFSCYDVGNYVSFTLCFLNSDSYLYFILRWRQKSLKLSILLLLMQNWLIVAMNCRHCLVVWTRKQHESRLWYIESCFI